MKPRNQCIICGRKFHLSKVEFPHGTVYVCYDRKCKEMIALKVNDDDYAPIIWVGRGDLYEDDDNHVLTEEELKTVTDEELIHMASDLQDWIWNDSFGQDYHEGLKQVCDFWKENKEMKHIRECPKKDLPLLIGNLKFDSNQKVLEERLRGKIK